MSDEKDWIAVKALTRGWLMENSIALTGTAGEISRSTVNRFKLALQKRIVDYVTTIRQEERRAALKDAAEIASEEMITAEVELGESDSAYNKAVSDIVTALEAAANENKEGSNHE